MKAKQVNQKSVPLVTPKMMTEARLREEFEALIAHVHSIDDSVDTTQFCLNLIDPSKGYATSYYRVTQQNSIDTPVVECTYLEY